MGPTARQNANALAAAALQAQSPPFDPTSLPPLPRQTTPESVTPSSCYHHTNIPSQGGTRSNRCRRSHGRSRNLWRRYHSQSDPPLHSLTVTHHQQQAEEEGMRQANERKQAQPRDDRSRRQDFLEPQILAEAVKKIGQSRHTHSSIILLTVV